MSPYLLFGFFVAGLLSVLITRKLIERHLGGDGIWPIVKAALFGVPLPLCSCGVIPVASSLRMHGANRGAITAFLISTPQTGVDSIAVTYSLLGPVYAVFRPIAALVSGIVGGMLVAVCGEKDRPNSGEEAPDKCPGAERTFFLWRVLNYGFVTLPRDIAGAIIVGIMIAGVIAVSVPDDYFSGAIGQGVPGMLVMMLVGIPLYVCATASVPIAAALMAKGVSAGAALVFLMTGPATNAAAIATIWKIMGKYTALLYLGTVALTALISGIALDSVILSYPPFKECHAHGILPGPVQWLSSILLLLVLAAAIWGKKKAPAGRVDADGRAPIAMTILGMRCSHCVDTVKRELLRCSGVEKAEVELAGGKIFVYGDGLDISALQALVRKLGYTIAP